MQSKLFSAIVWYHRSYGYALCLEVIYEPDFFKDFLVTFFLLTVYSECVSAVAGINKYSAIFDSALSGLKRIKGQAIIIEDVTDIIARGQELKLGVYFHDLTITNKTPR